MSKQRENDILRLVSRKKFISYTDLCTELFISESTLRRDVTAMFKKGLIQKVKGGVMSLETKETETTSELKRLEKIEEKNVIADLACDFIGKNQTIFLDSSTTCFYLAKAIMNTPRITGNTFITTSLISAPLLSENRQNEVYLTGGKILSNRDSVNGLDTCDYLAKCHFDLAFISCRGFDVDFGVSEFSKEEASLKRIVEKNSDKLVLLIDDSKFEKKFPYQSMQINVLDDVVTNSRLPKCYEDYLFKEDVNILFFDESI